LSTGSATGDMSSTSADPVGGVCPIIATPFTAGDAVDYDSLRTQIEFLEEGGCHAAALFGWASEYYRLTDDERDRMAEVAVDASGEMPLVLSVTHEATAVAEERAAAYEAAGADCVMTLPGATRGPSTDAILDHVRRVGRAVDVPVMVQLRADGPSVPPARLAEVHDDVPNVRYVKVETDDPPGYIGELGRAAPGMDTLVGNGGKQMIQAYARDAVGVVPGSSMFDVYLTVHERLEADDLAGALDVHADLFELVAHLEHDFIGYEKEISARRGMIATPRCRAPNPPAPDEPHRDLFETLYDRVSEYFRV